MSINLNKISLFTGQNSIEQYIAGLGALPEPGFKITCHRIFPGVESDFGENRLPWSRAVQKLLSARGIRLYSHQTLATDHIRAGHSIVAATPTASGKSLIYNLPVLESYLKDPDTHALYLFPLKALSQDQLAAFNAFCAPWPKDARPAAAIYDGDTTAYMRRKIKNDPPCALISTPEMLHLGILPFHAQWTTFLANLNYVIVDEAHTYRGVFGSHMAQVFRRLNRITSRYGSRPTYIFCTATLGNPDELAGALMDARGGEEPVLINKSGAPQGKRHFLFIDPDKSPATCAIQLLGEALKNDLRVIVYCRSRRMTELISIWAGAESGPYRNQISAYRAGYLAEERRKIEARMASGELKAVISTSALELGIDIGGLDVCILVGYPGTIMQTLQRGGRVGRAQQESAVILVAGEDALDQYFVRHPDDFFTRPAEKAVVNPDNDIILARHLECAAAEMPLCANEFWLQAPYVRKILLDLQHRGLLMQSADGSQWLPARKMPHRDIDMRGAGNSYIIENETGDAIGIVEGRRVWHETHPGAVYIHHGKTYVVDRIDDGKLRIQAKAARVSWFTRSRSNKQTEILEVREHASIGRCAVFRGKLRITERITGYEKRAASGNRLLSITPLDVPPYIFDTEGMWFVIPDNIRILLEDRFIHFMGSIHALEHAIIGLLPLEVMADRNDFGGISIPLHPQLGLAAVFVYDGLAGGSGLTRAAFPNARRILQSTQKVLLTCDCEDGCPSCVHSPKCGSGNRPLSKMGAIELLGELLAPGNEGDEISTRIEIPQDLPKADLDIQPPAHYVVFDVETRLSAAEVGGWQNASLMGVSVAVLYDSVADAYFTYEQGELEGMFAKMAAAELVVGFNSFRFDYKVLEPFVNQLNIDGFSSLTSLPGLDLLQVILHKLNYRVSLDNLASATLGASKSADGLQALRWWREGRIADIAAYCRKDVELTRNLYLFGLEKGYVIFSNKAGQKVRLPVDFSL